MKFDILKIEEQIEKKNLHRQKHPTKELWIYKYSKSCVYSKGWNDITLACRGLVMDAEGNVVSNPMPKFFNVEEIPNVINARMDQGQPYVITDKMDGSLIMAFMHEGELMVTSSGSFTSPQAGKAMEMLTQKYPDFVIKDGKTYVFEIIYPENRIVLDYGDHEGLTLLAIRDTATGREEDLIDIRRHQSVPVVEVVEKTMDEIRKEQSISEFINKEGYVVAFSSGSDLYRVKVKLNEYMRLHKIVSGVNEKYIWECLKDGVSMQDILDNVPDEMYDWINKCILDFGMKFSEAHNKAVVALEEVKKELGEGFSRKDFARVVIRDHKGISGILFSLVDDKPADETIWKNLKPETVTRFGIGENV